jgi:hypothetical protein
MLRHFLQAHSSMPLAVTRNDNASCDMAIAGPGGRLLIVRIVSRSSEQDCDALKAMLAQGDFDSAVLVYCDRNLSELPSDIASWWIGDVDRLVALIARGRVLT